MRGEAEKRRDQRGDRRAEKEGERETGENRKV